LELAMKDTKRRIKSNSAAEPTIDDAVMAIVFYASTAEWTMLEVSAWLLQSIANREAQRARGLPLGVIDGGQETNPPVSHR
jgi:hypothetical protein